MDRSKYHRLLFLIAAIWNWVLAASFLILPRINISYFLLGGYTIPPSLLWFDCFMGEILAFGIGFYIVSLNVNANHGIIAIGTFEKLWVFTLSLYYFLIHEATPLLLLVVIGDLLFALLFLEDLRAIRKMT
jgi:hypothetical protein